MSENTKIKLGISACLLGHNVRYDAGHKLDRYMRDTLGQFVEWVPVCPEAECGLSIPREAMHLADYDGAIRLVTVRSSVDHTARMRAWSTHRLDELAQDNLCGYVFKSKSPSSGMTRIGIYSPEGRKIRTNGVGMFAQAFMERFPLQPVEDEGRLHDAVLRENFIERVFAYGRWQAMITKGGGKAGLVDFHARHKLLLMAHSPKGLRELGALVAHQNKSARSELLERYLHGFMNAMRLIATAKKHVNALQHIMGYFKKQLTPDEKAELIEVIENYHNGHAPLIVPLVLIKHYVRKYHQPYLMQQYYLDPAPAELMLRNHA